MIALHPYNLSFLSTYDTIRTRGEVVISDSRLKLGISWLFAVQ